MREALAALFRLDVASVVPRLDGVSCRRWVVDVLSRTHGFVVEFDGSYWHSEERCPGKAAADAAKADDIRGQGLLVVRVREAPLRALHADDLVVPLGLSGTELGALVVRHLLALGVSRV